MRVHLPSLLILLVVFAVPALAEEKSSDIVMSLTSSEIAGSGEGGPFPPGALIETVVEMRNRGGDALNMRRIVIQSSPSLILLDPALDTLDNDFDGTIDDRAEALQRKGDDGAAWRLLGDGIRIEPGETLRRMMRFRVRRDALAGTSGFFSLSTGTTLAEGPRSRPQRSRRVFPVAFIPPRPSLELSETDALTVASKPIVTARIVLPGGIIPDTTLSYALPPAMQATKILRIETGPAITCAAEDTMITEGGATATLGSCESDGDRPEDERRITFAIETALTDADPHGSDATIAKWRDLRAGLTVQSGPTTLAETHLSAQLTGPLVQIIALSDPATGLRPGDTLTRVFTLKNRGDRPLTNARIRLTNPATFDCGDVEFTGVTPAIPCRRPAALPASLAPGETITATISATLRPDALIEADTALAIELRSDEMATTLFPAAPLSMATHTSPNLTIAEARDWMTEGPISSATIGQTARLRIRGTLPPGRYPGDVRLLSRMVDARTGAPVSPAVIEVGDAHLSITGPDDEMVLETTIIDTRPDSIWSQYVLPFDLRDDEVTGASAREFTAEIDVTLADDPSLRRDRLLEITAESTAFGDSTVSSPAWAEVLITEPDLRLKLFSLDDDRVIQPGEPLAVVLLACNYGDSAAHGTSMRLDLPERLDIDALANRAFKIPLEVVQNRAFSILSDDAKPEDQARITLDRDKFTLTLDQNTAMFDARECLGIEMRGPLVTDRTGSATNIAVEARLDAYFSISKHNAARRYLGGSSSILRFRVPAVRFGPSDMIRLGDARRLDHNLELAVPSYLGPFRLSLSPESSTGLDWALFDRQPSGKLTPWNEGTDYPAGATIPLAMRADAPRILPLGWVDTSTLRAVILADDGRSFAATLRLVIRGGSGPTNAIETSKRVALDRDCDGELGDEIAQDAVFEAGKDAAPGDCLIVRIEFTNVGTGEVERIVIRDVVSARTTLLPDSPNVRIAPEPLDRVLPPDSEQGTLEWEFEGLFRPGAVGEVEYGLRLNPLTGQQ